MEVLIYNYEGSILRFINSCIPDIKIASYATDEDIILAISDVKYFPTFYFSREEVEWNNSKTLSVLEGSTEYKFLPFLQKYKGTVIVEDAIDAQKLASALKFYWDKNSKVNICWPSKDDELSIQLRLLYIKIKEIRRPSDVKGSCRAVEFGWQSQLFINPLELDSKGLVEKVNIYIAPDNSLMVRSNSGEEFKINELMKVYG